MTKQMKFYRGFPALAEKGDEGSRMYFHPGVVRSLTHGGCLGVQVYDGVERPVTRAVWNLSSLVKAA